MNNIPDNIESKVCSKCGESFPLTAEFWPHEEKNRDNFSGRCKKCRAKYDRAYRAKNKKKIAAYHAENKKKIANRQAKYQSKNKEKIFRYKAEYRTKNKKKIAKKKANYYAGNKAKVIKYRAECYIKNKDNLKNKTMEYLAAPANYKTYAPQLVGIEKTRQSKNTKGDIEVTCAYCGIWFSPTNVQVRNRINAINETGGSRFYCSENCKQECPVFNRKKYPKGFKKATSREVVPELRQMVFKYDNYTCQRCGATTKDVQLHAHHIKGAVLEPMLANDITNVITLCKECHKEVHKQEGCSYIDYRRSKCAS